MRRRKSNVDGCITMLFIPMIILAGIVVAIIEFWQTELGKIILIGVPTIIIILIITIKRNNKLKRKNTTNSYQHSDYKQPYLFKQQLQSYNEAQQTNDTKQYSYIKKTSLVTNAETYFYDILNKHFSDSYLIMPQVNLASIIEKIGNFRYQNELFRNIDFGIFDKQDLSIKVLIEINDSTHRYKKRAIRDKKVKEICSNANIPLLTFYINMPNEPNYIVNRINQYL